MQGVEAATIRTQILARLRRVEGQVRGIHKMVEDERDCREILQQLNATLAALQNAGELFVRAYAKDCLLNMEATDLRDRESMIDTLLDLMIKARS